MSLHPLSCTIAGTLFKMLSFIFVLSCLYLELASAHIDLTAVASSANVIYSDFPLQRTPDGGKYLINITFTGHGQTLPMQLDLSAPTTWVNIDSTFCWTHGNLVNLSDGNCGVTFSREPSSYTPIPAYWYYNSDEELMLGKHSVQDVSLGNFQVLAQDMILADQNWILPDMVSAGVLGLAYPEALASSPIILLSPSPSKP
jgi:hypothetical protein